MGIQNDRIRTTITAQQYKNKNLSLSDPEIVRKLSICTPDQYDQILEGFGQFLCPAEFVFFFHLLRCDRGSNAVVLNTHIGYFRAT